MGSWDRDQPAPLVLQILFASVGIAMGVVFMGVGASVGGTGAPRFFGLPFFLAGLAVAASSAHGVYKAIRARVDDGTPATGGPLATDRDLDLSDLTFADDRRREPTQTRAAVSTPPPPGWYLDPGGSGSRRWWDGRTWTEHLR